MISYEGGLRNIGSASGASGPAAYRRAAKTEHNEDSTLTLHWIATVSSGPFDKAQNEHNELRLFKRFHSRLRKTALTDITEPIAAIEIK